MGGKRKPGSIASKVLDLPELIKGFALTQKEMADLVGIPKADLSGPLSALLEREKLVRAGTKDGFSKYSLYGKGTLSILLKRKWDRRFSTRHIKNYDHTNPAINSQ